MDKVTDISQCHVRVLFVAVDVSGSTDRNKSIAALEKIKKNVKADKIHLILHDHTITHHSVHSQWSSIRNEDLIFSHQGTDFEPVVDLVAQHLEKVPSLLILVTDGQGWMPEKNLECEMLMLLT